MALNIKYLKKLKFLNILVLIFLLFSFNINNYGIFNMFKYQEDDLTLVSAYYRIKSKFTSNHYLNWLSNIVMLNKSFVFFTNKEFMPTLKLLRPKELHYKSVFIELEMEDFYSNITFYNDFKETFHRDPENIIMLFNFFMLFKNRF